MKKIIDERLQIQNLKNIRTAFVIQTLGILAILAFEFIEGGMEQVRSTPLWFVLMISMLVFVILQMNISVQHEKSQQPKRSLMIYLLVTVIVSLSFLLGVYFTNNQLKDAMIIGLVFLICGTITSLYLYHLRKKQIED